MKVKVKVNQFLYKPITDTEGSRSLRLLDFKTIDTRRWLGCHPYAPAAFSVPQNIPVTHLCERLIRHWSHIFKKDYSLVSVFKDYFLFIKYL